MNIDYKVAEVEMIYRNRVPKSKRTQVRDSYTAYKVLKEQYSDGKIDYKEIFKVLYLNHACQIVGCSTISEGGICATVADVRNILQGALLTNATAMILAHNHPSGNIRPSINDDTLTKKIVDAAQIMDIRVNDHIILTSEEYYSYSDEGRI